MLTALDSHVYVIAGHLLCLSVYKNVMRMGASQGSLKLTDYPALLENGKLKLTRKRCRITESTRLEFGF